MSKFNKKKYGEADAYFNKLKEKGVIIEVKEVRGKRTLDQNGLYWLWLTVIEGQAGYNRDELHCLFKAKFLRKKVPDNLIVPKTMERINELAANFQYYNYLPNIIDIISTSTTELDTKEFAKYLTSIQDYTVQNMKIELKTLKDINFDKFYSEFLSNN